MAVFVAASDEGTDGTNTGPFLLGGWVARERLWSKSFAPMWQRRVLNGPPKIDYLHVVDLKSPKWRAKHGVTADDAERRQNAAFEIINGAQGLFPIAHRLNAGHFRPEFADVKLRIQTAGGLATKVFEPDYLCFFLYAMQVLNYVHVVHKDAEKVDFVIERNGRITKHIERFHESMPNSLRKVGLEHLSRLMGDLIPGGKERVPLQAADVLVWYTNAAEAGTLSDADRSRYEVIATRKGHLEQFSDDEITAMARRAEESLNDPNDEDADALSDV